MCGLFAQQDSQTAAGVTAEVCRTAVVFVSTFLWDVEPLLRSSLMYRGFRRVAIFSSLSSAAHGCHPDKDLRQPLDFRCARAGSVYRRAVVCLVVRGVVITSSWWRLWGRLWCWWCWWWCGVVSPWATGSKYASVVQFWLRDAAIRIKQPRSSGAGTAGDDLVGGSGADDVDSAAAGAVRVLVTVQYLPLFFEPWIPTHSVGTVPGRA